jgi:hypothetical protein
MIIGAKVEQLINMEPIFNAEAHAPTIVDGGIFFECL